MKFIKKNVILQSLLITFGIGIAPSVFTAQSLKEQFESNYIKPWTETPEERKKADEEYRATHTSSGMPRQTTPATPSQPAERQYPPKVVNGVLVYPAGPEKGRAYPPKLVNGVWVYPDGSVQPGSTNQPKNEQPPPPTVLQSRQGPQLEESQVNAPIVEDRTLRSLSNKPPRLEESRMNPTLEDRALPGGSMKKVDTVKSIEITPVETNISIREGKLPEGAFKSRTPAATPREQTRVTPSTPRGYRTTYRYGTRVTPQRQRYYQSRYQVRSASRPAAVRGPLSSPTRAK